jgi:hypothetical protein
LETLIPHLPIGRSSRQKINKQISELNNTIEQMDLTDIYRLFHQAATYYTFLSEAHTTVYKIEHILGYKASLSKCEKI